jgi:hypothetical protein
MRQEGGDGMSERGRRLVLGGAALGAVEAIAAEAEEHDMELVEEADDAALT